MLRITQHGAITWRGQESNYESWEKIDNKIPRGRNDSRLKSQESQLVCVSMREPQNEYQIIIISPSRPHMRQNKPLQCPTSLPSPHMTLLRKHKQLPHPVFTLTMIQLHECVSVFNILSAFLEPQKEKVSIKSRIPALMPEFRKLPHQTSCSSCSLFQRDWKMTS